MSPASAGNLVTPAPARSRRTTKLYRRKLKSKARFKINSLYSTIVVSLLSSRRLQHGLHRFTGAKAEARCLHMHADASLSQRAFNMGFIG
jgi:hypothetical protein